MSSERSRRVKDEEKKISRELAQLKTDVQQRLDVIRNETTLAEVPIGICQVLSALQTIRRLRLLDALDRIEALQEKLTKGGK